MAMAISETVARRPNFMARKSTRKAVLIWSFLAPSLLMLAVLGVVLTTVAAFIRSRALFWWEGGTS